MALVTKRECRPRLEDLYDAAVDLKLDEGMVVKLYADLRPENAAILTGCFNDIASIEVGLLVP